MERSSEFLVKTVVFDVVLLVLLQLAAPPGDTRIYAAVGLLVVSPLLAYLFVYRWNDDSSTEGRSESSD